MKHKVLLAAIAAVLSLTASAQVVISVSEDGKPCTIRGIEPWAVGVSVPSDIYGDLSFYTDSDIDRDAITSSPEPDVTVIRWDKALEFEGMRTSSLTFTFFKGVLVRIDAVPADNRMYEVLLGSYGKGSEKGGTSFPGPSGMILDRESTWKSPDAFATYQRKTLWESPASDGSVTVRIKDSFSITDSGPDGREYASRM